MQSELLFGYTPEKSVNHLSEVELWQRYQALQAVEHRGKKSSKFSRLLARTMAVMGVGLLLLTACGGAEATGPLRDLDLPYNFAECNKPPQKPEVFRNDDPVFRAASVPLFIGEQGQPSNGWGHGALLEHEDGSLSITTVLHVAEIADTECLYAAIPGTGVIGALNPEQSWEWDREVYELVDTGFGSIGLVRDNIVSFRMTRSHEHEVHQAIKRGDVTPLRVSTSGLNTIDGLAIPNPETGKVGYYEIVDGDENKITMRAEAGYVCQGRSGGPMLREVNGQVFNEVAGFVYLVSKTHEDSYNGHQRYCSDDLAYAINALR